MPELGGSRLGFGCASLPGKLTRKEALALIEATLDAGISHFDTARMYHWGIGEALLGAVARHRRGDMIIVTKAGIAPANRFASAAANVLGGARLPYAAPRFGRFSPAQIRASVEQSLRALRTDRVDALLLHEIALEHVTDALKQELETLKSAGMVGTIGVATGLGATGDLVRHHPDLCGVVQVNHHWLHKPQRPLPRGALLITHSVLHRPFANGDDQAPHAALHAAMKQNINGVTLFSSSRLEHVRENAALQTISNDDAPAAKHTRIVSKP